MKRLLCALLLVPYCYFSHAQEGSQAKPGKVKARMSYYTTDDRQGELVVTGDRTPSIGNGQTPLELTQKGGFPGTPASVYTFPLTGLKTGENKIPVTLGDSTHPVTVTILPTQSNGVQVDFLTGLLHTGGLPLLPSGFYCYSPVQPTLPEEEVVRGMNMISPYQELETQPLADRIAYLDRAAALGMRVNYNLLSLAGGGGVSTGGATTTLKEELLRKEIRAVKDHPAILSWYVVDEPDMHGIPVEELEAIYRIVKEEDPYHPVTLVIMSAPAALKYASACDIVMLDRYPVPNSPASQVIDYTRDMHQALRYEKAVWYVPQTFGGAEWWAREPTAAEIRLMTWGAALEGARGFQGFIRKGLNGFPKSTHMWEAYTKACRELQDITPFFDRGTESVPQLETEGALVLRQYTLGDEHVLVVLNRNPEAATYKVTLDFPFDGTAYSLVDHSRRKGTAGVLEGMLPPFGVEVLRFYTNDNPQAWFAWEHNPVNKGNLLVDPSFEWEYSVAGNIPAATYFRVGDDRGGTAAIDSRVAYHGSHSMRLHHPGGAQGPGVQFFPPEMEGGKTYIMSLWAKADPQSLAENNGKMTFKVDLAKLAEAEFELTSEWKRYEIAGVCKEARMRWDVNCILEMVGTGTAWFDLVEIAPDLNLFVNMAATEKRAFQVTLNNNITGGKVHYTLDGSEPNKKSPVYDPAKPIVIRDVRTVKARVIGPDGTLYAVVEQQIAAHKGIGAEVIYGAPWQIFSGGGDKALVDGRTAAMLSYRDRAWQAFRDNDLEVVIDLKEPTLINRIESNYFDSQEQWILPPVTVEYLLSTDGENFESVGVIDLGEAPQKDPNRLPVVKNKIKKTARYIKVKAQRHSRMPSWHSGYASGESGLLFIDEVIVQ